MQYTVIPCNGFCAIITFKLEKERVQVYSADILENYFFLSKTENIVLITYCLQKYETRKTYNGQSVCQTRLPDEEL